MAALTAWVMGWSSGLPAPLSFVVVVLVWAVVVSVVAAALAVPTRSLLYGSRGRARRRYRKAAFRASASQGVDVEQVVARVVLEMLGAERLEAFLSLFGGRLVTRSPMEIVVNPRELLRVGSIVSAVVCAVASWPSNAAWRPDLGWGAQVDWDVVRVAVPLVVLAVGIVVVVPRAPLLDRIRARDEAAKDANRLLAKWSYAAVQLSDVLRRRAFELYDVAPQLVSERIGGLHAALSYAGGALTDGRESAERVAATVHRQPREGTDRSSDGRARQAIQALNDEIREAGLSDVARALVPSTWPFILGSGEHWMIDTDLPSGSLARASESLPARPLARLTPAVIEEYELARRPGGVGIGPARERLEALVRDVDERVRLSAVDLLLQAACLSIAHGKLTRRLLGTSWTRLLSAAKS